ncbi:MAG: hypothetical protein QQN65_06355 [Nitrosopumilus sp.]
MNVVQRLKEKEIQIKSLQEKKSRLEGKKEQLLSDLKEKFGVATLEEGQKLLEQKKTKLAEVEERIDGLLEKMDEIVEGAERE